MKNASPNIAVRAIGQPRVRWLRRRLPYPWLWAAAFNARLPAGYLADGKQLCRPESLAISHSGTRLAVSNSDGCDIAIFALEERPGRRPALQLLERVRDPKVFLYAHGAEFSLDDRRILALGEYDHSLSSIALTDHMKNTGSSFVEWTVSGVTHGLENPADLAIHPDGGWLVVANRMPTGLSVYAQESPCSSLPPGFRFNIGVPSFNSWNLSAPHGVAFSHDGSLLYVSHKPFFQNPLDNGKSAVSIFPCSRICPEPGELVPSTSFDFGNSHLHHVAVHPSGEFIAVTNSRGNVELLRWQTASRALAHRDTVRVFRAGDGAKGVAFTADGHYLMISTELDEILFFTV